MAQEPNIQKLVRAAQQGDREALAALYEQFLDGIYQFVYFRCGNREEAEDITSEVFLKMVKALPKFSGRSSFKTWLYAIAKNTVMDYFRRVYRLRTVPIEEFLHLEGDIAERVEEDELIEQQPQSLTAFLTKLPPNYAEVLTLRFLKGYSIRETAQQLHKTTANIKVLQYRAIQKAQQMAGTAKHK